MSAMLWHYSKGNQRNVVLYVVMSVIAVIIISLEPLVVGELLNTIQRGDLASSFWYILILLGCLVLIDLGHWFFHGISRVIETGNAYKAYINFKSYLLDGVLHLPLDWHADHHSGDTIDKVTKGVDSLYSFGENSFNVIRAFITLVVGVGVMVAYDPRAAVVLLALMLPTFYILALFDRVLVEGYKKTSFMENASEAKIFDIISNVNTVITLRIEALVHRALAATISLPYAQALKNSVNNELKWFSATILGRIVSVVVIGMYVWQGMEGAIMVGTIYILYGYIDRVRNVFFDFASMYNDIIRWRARVSNAEELTKEFRSARRSGECTMPENWKELEFSGLTFSYGADSQNKHLDNVHMKIRRGERVAVIGESGGGKSTLLKVLRDLYHPRAVTITVDGTPVASFADIADSISLIPQDPEIFTTNIRENITVGVEYTDTHIKVFTDMAKFTSVVERLPRGLESSIVEKGVNLSGGEKQRLALARGLLASENKTIILLDEPTSSVDFDNELGIYENIFDAFPNAAILSSVHRLHLLQKFDTIYYFKAGKIVAKGTLDDIKEHTDFKDLWERYEAANQTGA